MKKVRAIVPFVFYDEKRGHVNVDEGAEDVIEDAEAQRLAEAGILEIVGKPDRQTMIEAADLPSDGIESTVLKRGKKKE